MVLIYFLHLSKPSQYSLIWSTRQLPFYSNSSTHLFIPNSIHSWHSYQTSQTLHLNYIHIPSLGTTHTQCLCSIQHRWYNCSFILTLLRIYPQSFIAQQFSRPSHPLYLPFILCHTFLPHSPSAATCDPRYFIIILLLKKVGSARLTESDIYLISPKTPAPQYQLIDRKKRKGKRVEDYSRDTAA